MEKGDERMAVKRYKYSFTKQKHSEKGVVSTVLAGISLGLLLISAICSLCFHGKGGIYLGAAGVLAMGISIYGFYMGLKSFSEKNRSQVFSKVGALGSGVLMVVWLALFLVGLS